MADDDRRRRVGRSLPVSARHASGGSGHYSSSPSRRPPPPVAMPPPPAQRQQRRQQQQVAVTAFSSLDPVGVHAKTWMLRDYVWLSMALGLSPQGYMLGTLGLSLGLTWTWCLAAAFAAAILTAALAVAASHPSAKYGVPLCVAARAAFGVHGAKLASLLCLLLALPWCAWLLLVAAEGLTLGIARFKPAAAEWAPLPRDFLPSGFDSMLSLLALLASGIALWLWYTLAGQAGRHRGTATPGSSGTTVTGTPSSVRSFAPTAALAVLGLYVGTAVWLGRAVGVEASLAAYDRMADPDLDLPLYVSVPLAVLAGLGCFASPLLLGFPDLARWSRRRADPKHALLGAFPPAATAAAFLGILITGGVARGFSTQAPTPTAVLRFESPTYMALVGGIILALAALHAALAGYVVAAGHALTDVLSPPLGLHDSRVAGSAFLLGALALALLAPRELLDSTRISGGAGAVAYHPWSQASGLLAGALLGVLLADYHLLRGKRLPTDFLYRTFPRLHGCCGVNAGAVIAVLCAFLAFAFRAVVLRALGPNWTGPELLPALGFLTTFPLSFLAYVATFRSFTYPPTTAASALDATPPTTAVGAAGAGRVSATAGPTAAGERARETYPPRRRGGQPLPPPPPMAVLQQSASSRATEQLTATLHQLLAQPHPPPSAPPEECLHPAPDHHAIAIPAAAASSPARAKPSRGADDETKMERGGQQQQQQEEQQQQEAASIPLAYAVTVHTDEGK